MDQKKIREQLIVQIDEGRVIANASMKEHTSFQAGGSAKLLIQPGNREELIYAIDILRSFDMDYFVMGNGTNILVQDGGYDGAILKLGKEFSSIVVRGDTMEAEAGALLSAVGREALAASLAGFAFAAGIPGSIGGAVFMNAGAYGGEFSSIIESAEVLSREGNKVFSLTKEEMELSYRSSVFHRTGDIVLKVNLKLTPGDQEEIKHQMADLAARRREKQPLSLPSAGSTFKRPTGYFAGKLIQDAGLSGLSLGGAQVSPLHAGFIVNNGKATAKDIIDLMEIVKQTVLDQFGVLLEAEVRILGKNN